eukprot:TRINITY_DN1863_c0_g1_i9.p1 TRINITY_DN1863_c0_g1~~TRINITY_DN1863_c0_g1_i9.p1  ORF type:complete len:157 (+),score=22.78 TRINITY_DN1863_c0_g1_i9:271-741(+)
METILLEASSENYSPLKYPTLKEAQMFSQLSPRGPIEKLRIDRDYCRSSPKNQRLNPEFHKQDDILSLSFENSFEIILAEQTSPLPPPPLPPLPPLPPQSLPRSPLTPLQRHRDLSNPSPSISPIGMETKTWGTPFGPLHTELENSHEDSSECVLF